MKLNVRPAPPDELKFYPTGDGMATRAPLPAGLVRHFHLAPRDFLGNTAAIAANATDRPRSEHSAPAAQWLVPLDRVTLLCTLYFPPACAWDALDLRQGGGVEDDQGAVLLHRLASA